MEQLVEIDEKGNITPVTLPLEEEVLFIEGEKNLIRINPATGEILEVDGAPYADGRGVAVEHYQEDIAEWVGRKRSYWLAQAEGLKAEKAELQARLDRQYDPQIRLREKSAAWVTERYLGVLREYAERLLAGKTARSITKHLLTFAFRKTKAKATITEPISAMTWAEESCPDAVKITKSILVSMIPAERQAEASEHGFDFYAGGDDTFEVK